MTGMKAGNGAARTQVTLSNSEQEDPQSLIRQIHQARWLSGEYPCLRHISVNPAKRSTPMVLPGGQVLIEDHSAGTDAILQEAKDHSWLLTSYRRGARSQGITLYFAVAAKTDKQARKLLRILTKDARRNVRQPKDPNTINVKFWYNTRDYPDATWRKIRIHHWHDIEGNYTANLRDPVSRLMKTSAEEVNGRIILMHGPPGTGKTTLLRALGGAWRSWCEVHYVMDPDKMLMSGAYMTEVLLDQQDSNRWRLIVMEDTGELFNAEAREEMGQAFARLLNMSDGMLGQGLKVMFALTTNKPITEVHDAVVRPGRAMAALSVPKLTTAEAKTWLNGQAPLPDGKKELTLAELLALRDPVSMEVITNTPDDLPTGGHGQYL